MADIFNIEIITPDRILYTGETDFVEFTTAAGDIGVYRNHIPMTTVLAPGAVVIHKAGEQTIAAVHAGFAEILNDKITILAEVAEWPNEIDVARAEAAKVRAEQRIANRTDDLDIKRAELALRRAMTRIDVAGR
ncbi:MAG: F0F1 ATP synthase subunit epsilon [Lachnospiraceae bacterium]|nr:F0F1 ATP synthase subunit epsilon [Lachnospiraceae bacterium]